MIELENVDDRNIATPAFSNNRQTVDDAGINILNIIPDGARRRIRNMFGVNYAELTGVKETVSSPVMCLRAQVYDDSLPKSYNDIANFDDRLLWYEAVAKEYQSLQKNSTRFIPKAVPANANVIDGTWVFRKKKNADGSILKYKARFCARGFNQIEGIDFSETYAPVSSFTALRVLLTKAASLDYEIHQIDWETAFLNPKVKEDRLQWDCKVEQMLVWSQTSSV